MPRGLARGRSGERLDAADTGRDAGIRHPGDEADIAGAPTCVPPHSSTDQPKVLPEPSPMATTRTSSLYFSPNSARAPDARASSSAIRRVVTGEFCSTKSLAMSSTFSISAAVIGFGCEKSKRSRSGATSEPFWAT